MWHVAVLAGRAGKWQAGSRLNMAGLACSTWLYWLPGVDKQWAGSHTTLARLAGGMWL